MSQNQDKSSESLELCLLDKSGSFIIPNHGKFSPVIFYRSFSLKNPLAYDIKHMILNLKAYANRESMVKSLSTQKKFKIQQKFCKFRDLFYEASLSMMPKSNRFFKEIIGFFSNKDFRFLSFSYKNEDTITFEKYFHVSNKELKTCLNFVNQRNFKRIQIGSRKFQDLTLLEKWLF